MQEVVLDRNVRLLDSPGVVFDDKTALLGNCVDAESMEDPIPPVAELLNRCNHSSLLMTYNIPSFPPGDVMMFLAMVARSHGRVLKGGIPDKVAAARAILKDWNSGKIPFYTPPPKTLGTPDVADDAMIVSTFGKEFDLEKFDEQVLSGLKDSDEMDFVQLDGGNSAEKMELDEKRKRQAIRVLAGEGGDSESMDEDSDGSNSSDDEPTLGRKRAELANADDYDFTSMT